MSNYDTLFKAIDAQKPEMIKRLRQWVEIKSVSCQADTRPQVFQMMEQAKKEWEALGAKMELIDNPKKFQMSPDGQEIPLPPILLGTYPEKFDANKQTVLIYGHLDVQPANLSDGWDYDPWTLTETNGKLYGRGSTDDKAPVLGWLISLEEMKKAGIELPVNLKLCFEGMEESGSEGLDELIFEVRPEFFNTGVDSTVISDNYWLGLEKPCLTYGLRGICYWHLTVECAARDLHSGVFGGTVHEAMTDMVNILASLVDNKGNILVEGVNDSVDAVTEAEMKSYETIDFCCDAFKAQNGTNLIHEGQKEKTLQHRWRFPSLSLHGIEGAFHEPGEKTVIPRRVIGKFSIRLVPSMQPKALDELMQAHIKKVTESLNTPNKVWCTLRGEGGKPWYGCPDNQIFKAATRATKRVYKMEPDLTREGGSIPVTLSFQNSTGKDVILIPMGAADDGAHSQNEKIDIRNYIEGTKLLGAYLLELGEKQE